MWIGTFHSVCVRILRKHIEKIGFTSSFNIFDTTDQKTLMKECLKELNVDDKLFPERYVLSIISNAKNEMIDEIEYEKQNSSDFRLGKIAKLYKLYQQKLRQNNSLDFDDIINYTIKILMDNPDILAYYCDKFKYVLVDEYQDTNKAQFILVSLFASMHGNITVVGDDSQSIYSFRGADISNILNFERDFPNATIIKLEQNYRSTGNILNIANGVIANNKNALKKKLWTKNEEGEKPTVKKLDNEYDEASFIVNMINHLKIEEYYNYSDFAILYRMNAQSRSIEDILLREGIPYKVVGGQKFYERKEIKDTIAYLRLINNTSDNLSLTRIINEPKRGIGTTSIDKLSNIAEENHISMFEAAKNAEKFGLMKIALNAKDFVEIIESLNQKRDELKISEIIKQVLEKTGYIKALEQQNTIETTSRIENIEEFLTVAMEFESENAENSLADFLENLALISDIDKLDDEQNAVTLMTLHSAKGLEFKTVFMVGLEEGMFPSYRSIGEEHEIEEERRLCYVGITRAKEHLFITYTKYRTIFGSTTYNQPSRFIKELPKDLIINETKEESKHDNDTGLETRISVSYLQKSQPTHQFRTVDSFLNQAQKGEVDLSKFKIGQTVTHKKFGIGVITDIEPEEDDLKVDINFEKVGHKRLMAKYANLVIP